MNDLQKDLREAVYAAIVKVIPNGKLRRQATGEPGELRLYVEPKGGKVFDCVTAFHLIFGEDEFAIKHYDRHRDFIWQPLGFAKYADGAALRALVEGVRQRAAADVTMAG